MILEKTVVFKVSPDLSGENDMENLTFAAQILRKGGLVAVCCKLKSKIDGKFCFATAIVAGDYLYAMVIH